VNFIAKEKSTSKIMEAIFTKNNKTEQGFEIRKQRSYDMIVFCHLCWDFVHQRPQYIISRMAKQFKILFIEKPYPLEGQRDSQLIEVSPMLHVLKPNVHRTEDIYTILSQYVNNSAPISIGWFYSPSFISLLNHFDFTTVVYDCMDELSLVKGASSPFIDQEQYLLTNADMVFTGSKALYESKALLHKNVYYFPSSVEEIHFAKALQAIAVPEEIASFPACIVGYCGIIDERIDLPLLDEIAVLEPDVSFVMIGPITKISEHELPKRPNIHYLGIKNYNELPNYIKAFDIAMIPFALNDATKYISPSKTLEYMAAGKPIVSTAIKDVVHDYSHCITIIQTAQDFAKAIKEDFADFPDPVTQREYTSILKNTSWDSTVAAMQSLIKSKTLDD